MLRWLTQMIDSIKSRGEEKKHRTKEIYGGISSIHPPFRGSNDGRRRI